MYVCMYICIHTHIYTHISNMFVEIIELNNY